MTCGTCRFAEPVVLSDGPQVECRRYPPLVIAVEDNASQLWPQVERDDWCGEYQPAAVDLPEQP